MSPGKCSLITQGFSGLLVAPVPSLTLQCHEDEQGFWGHTRWLLRRAQAWKLLHKQMLLQPQNQGWWLASKTLKFLSGEFLCLLLAFPFSETRMLG